MKQILKFLMVISLIITVQRMFGQKSSFGYQCQHFWYSRFDFGGVIERFELKGIRQELSYHQAISNKFSVALKVFVGSGRGRDISGDFKKDYILLSKNNWQNVPISLTNGFNNYFEGIYHYNRIAEGMSSDHGYGFSLFYHVLNKKKLSIDAGLGYLVYNSKLNMRNIVMDLSISNNHYFGDLQNYRINYPAPIIIDYSDGAFSTNLQVSYQVSSNIFLGSGVTYNFSPWTYSNDLGLGVNFKYLL
jgi:hypothetical protein